MLEGKNVLITGSSSGIGLATAKLAKQYGANVIVHGKIDSEDLRAFANELQGEYIVCDVADKVAVEYEIKRILEKVGKIDILINSAGISLTEEFLGSTDEFWLEIFKVNVLGTTHFCQAVIPQMRENKYGRIVNISSIKGFYNMAGNGAYSASKAAIISITASLAKEFAPHIAVNAIAPGYTDTPMSKTRVNSTAMEKAKTALVGRVGRPEEIAEAILFLASDRASFITGQTLLVDGGYSISEK